MWQEFKTFALKGNVLDLAIGVIIGGAFGKIVSSVVSDIIMPFFGYITAGMEFTALKWVLSPAVMDGDVVVKAEAAIMYGNFIQNIVDFLIVALSIFLFVKAINKLNAKKEEPAPAPEPQEPTPSELDLLSEIRDLLKDGATSK